MCIIAAKPIGVDLPSRNILENCFTNNPDGAGFMLADGQAVRIHKGFMTFDDFWRVYQKALKRVNPKETAIVYHFRISTQGGVTQGGTHPFPVSAAPEMLTKLNVRCHLGVAHNGIISLTSSYSKSQKYSDTQLFIMDYLSKIDKLHRTWYKNKAGKALVEELIDSKLAILDGTGRIELIGDFNEDKGIMYSNYSWNDYYAYAKYSAWNWDDGYVTTSKSAALDYLYLTELSGCEDLYVRTEDGDYLDLDPMLYAISYSGKLYEIIDNTFVCPTEYSDPFDGTLRPIKHDWKESKKFYIVETPPVIDYTIEDAKAVLTEYMNSTFGVDPDFSDLKSVPIYLASSTKVYANLEEFSLNVVYKDGSNSVIDYPDMQTFIECELNNLDDTLLSIYGKPATVSPDDIAE